MDSRLRGNDGYLSLIAPFLILLPLPAHAQTVSSSDRTNDVSVSIYRDPNRGDGPVNRDWPGGYALISETRTITVPAGAGVLRFVGVAEGMLPESAIVTGLPAGVIEKNRDARLLSAHGLLDAHLKRRVSLVRTNLKTGKKVQQSAIVQSGPDGGVLLETPDGVEALGCSGLPERPSYTELPDGLSARPVYSVRTRAKAAMTVSVKLTYLAQGFDWYTSYVANLEKDVDTLSLTGWATILNGGAQSFPNARLQLIAGSALYQRKDGLGQERAPDLTLQCWPIDVTSTHPRTEFERLPFYSAPQEQLDFFSGETKRKGERMFDVASAPMMAMAPPPPPPAPPAMVAQQEQLGDLKLYRVPERVTVAAQSSKQIALMAKDKVSFERLYTFDLNWGLGPARIALDMVNTPKKGLGLPLPSGMVNASHEVEGEWLFGGESAMRDIAVGEEFRIMPGSSPLVRGQLVNRAWSNGRETLTLKISNAHDEPVPVELLMPGRPEKEMEGVALRNGRWSWRMSVPAHETLDLGYVVQY
ncbi:MAG TPA: hypothetical protein PKA59_07065 [Chakrabartia sp.]|nr:hypothetical protein [Chakrabartia sp.]